MTLFSPLTTSPPLAPPAGPRTIMRGAFGRVPLESGWVVPEMTTDPL